MTDIKAKNQKMKEKKLEIIDMWSTGSLFVPSGKTGHTLSEQVKMFAEEYARKGVTLTQPQYAKRFGVSDRQIRRWLSDSNVQELIQERKKMTLSIDLIDELESPQLQELKKRVDTIMSERGNGQDRILEALDKILLSLEGIEHSDFRIGIYTVLEKDEKRRGEWREPNAAYYKQMSQIFELIAMDLNKEEMSQQ